MKAKKLNIHNIVDELREAGRVCLESCQRCSDVSTLDKRFLLAPRQTKSRQRTLQRTRDTCRTRGLVRQSNVGVSKEMAGRHVGGTNTTA